MAADSGLESGLNGWIAERMSGFHAARNGNPFHPLAKQHSVVACGQNPFPNPSASSAF
jgi:hypothetical protein